MGVLTWAIPEAKSEALCGSQGKVSATGHWACVSRQLPGETHRKTKRIHFPSLLGARQNFPAIFTEQEQDTLQECKCLWHLHCPGPLPHQDHHCESRGALARGTCREALLRPQPGPLPAFPGTPALLCTLGLIPCADPPVTSLIPRGRYNLSSKPRMKVFMLEQQA